MTVATIPAHLPFLDQLAARWIAHSGHDRLAMGEGTIVLPGRRAARALTEAFLRQMNGQGMLLPRIMPIGALDEAELGLALTPSADGQSPLDLPPAIGGMTRLAVLTKLVLQADDAFGTRPTLDQAWPLARALAELMDEAEWAGIALDERLPDAVQEDFAEHWQTILKFLSIVTTQWPEWLREQGAMNPIARQTALMRMQAALWRQQAAQDTGQGAGQRLWAAGFTHVMTPTVEALSAVLAGPQGCVVLPGLDMAMPADVFDTLPDSHPQAGMQHLLRALGVNRADVSVWNAEGGVPDRTAVLSRIMLPAQALDDWALPGHHALPDVLRLDPQDEQEEAVAISMAIRDAVETPQARVALITPDRKLASRVATELARWGILADDSAGTALADTPAAVLLRLIARAVDSGFAPVALLALLKHPLVACGLPPGVCRASARLLERVVLRGPAPPPGFAALRAAVQAALSAQQARDRTRMDGGDDADRPFGPEPLPAFMDRLATCLAPVLGWEDDATPPTQGGHTAPLPDLLAALVAVAEALARTDTQDPAARLWRGEEGNLLADRLTDLMLAATVLPPQPPAVLDGLLTAVLTQDRAAARKGDPTALHPRVLIWGLFEARLQTAETVILGGLSEGTWPPAADAGPWMSRPMRQKVGLPSPEQGIGQAAHDFFASATAAQRVILSCPRRREGAPVVPARWLTRLDAFLSGRNTTLPTHPAQHWLTGLDLPAGAARPVSPPRPTPPTALRPRRLSVTEIETWMRDPYAIYARHVLKLLPLPELEEGADASDYGMIVHAALERWVRTYGAGWPANAHDHMARIFRDSLAEYSLRPALRAWWEPRLARIAHWVADTETLRRAEHGPPKAILTEAKGQVSIPHAPGGEFRLVGRADRIELGAEGSITVQDYKTGMLPTTRDVLTGWSPQLPLEAAMVLRGGFRNVPEAQGIDRLVYWRLTGGPDPGQEVTINSDEDQSLTDLAEATWQNLLDRISAYDNPDQPYLSHPHPGQEPRFADYARLARVPEWSTARTEGET